MLRRRRESGDLTPPPGAHDGDVGLTGYVAGWEARGHRGYDGFAWYRVHGPPLVDSAYPLYVDGERSAGSAIGVPGIWFPWGVGVSRAQLAYAAFDLVWIATLVRPRT